MILGHWEKVDPLTTSVAFHIETNRLICIANQVTGFYMKNNTGLIWVNLLIGATDQFTGFCMRGTLFVKD